MSVIEHERVDTEHVIACWPEQQREWVRNLIGDLRLDEAQALETLAATHDARVTELLAANNALLEQVRLERTKCGLTRKLLIVALIGTHGEHAERALEEIQTQVLKEIPHVG